MAQMYLQWIAEIGSSTFNTFLFDGVISYNTNKSQTSVDLPFPGLADSSAVINSFFGQVRTFDITFILRERSDDYTNGTGSPSTYSANEQKTWLLDNIFKSTGYNIFSDEDGVQYSGKIENFTINTAGNDPNKLDCTLTFKRGIVATSLAGL